MSTSRQFYTNIIFLSTTDSINTSTGSVQISGGLSIQKNVNIGGNLTVSNITSTNITTSNFVATTGTIPNVIHTNMTTTSLLVTGGGLIGTFNSNTLGNLYTTGGNIGINTTSPAFSLDINGSARTSNLTCTNISTSNIISSSGNIINLTCTNISTGTVIASSNISLAGTTASTSTTTGALTVSGGVGITGDINITGGIGIYGSSVFELGKGLTKEINAGKIGYGIFTSNTLDIVGGGTGVPRTVKISDNLTVSVVNVSASLTVSNPYYFYSDTTANSDKTVAFNVTTLITYNTNTAVYNKTQQGGFSNNAYTIPISGLWELNISVHTYNYSASTNIFIFLYKNGSALTPAYANSASTTYDYFYQWNPSILFASGDVISVYFLSGGASCTIGEGSGRSMYFSGKLICN